MPFQPLCSARKTQLNQTLLLEPMQGRPPPLLLVLLALHLPQEHPQQVLLHHYLEQELHLVPVADYSAQRRQHLQVLHLQRGRHQH